MFENCHSLIALNIPKLNIKNKNINKEQIFHGCNSLINKCISENEWNLLYEISIINDKIDLLLIFKFQFFLSNILLINIH